MDKHYTFETITFDLYIDEKCQSRTRNINIDLMTGDTATIKFDFDFTDTRLQPTNKISCLFTPHFNECCNVEQTTMTMTVDYESNKINYELKYKILGDADE